MAADKEIMKAIETLRLDRPGRAYRASAGIGERIELAAGLAELAQTFREEAELWSRSGAKGWKGSEADAYLVAQRVDDVAAQLDNAGGGAALSISVDVPGITDDDIEAELRKSAFPDNGCTRGQGCTVHPDSEGLHNFDDIEAELRASALRVDAVRDLAGLDALIADSVAKRRGHVRDELLPDGHPAAERKTAYDWNDDPRIDPVVVSWSDFGNSAHRLGMAMGPELLITRADFERARDGGAVTVGPRRRPQLPMAPGTRVEIKGDDVTAYLKGETNDIPGSAPLTPNSIASAPEADNPFARPATPTFGPLPFASIGIDKPALEIMPTPGPMLLDMPTVPPTWESETMTADGHRKPGLAPLLGQPGDAGTGYSHDYVPAGGRRFTFAELLTPIPAASLPPYLSHSQGNTIGDCGVKYRLQRVEGLPQVPQWANVGGSAFHAAVETIERMMVNGLSNGMPLDLGGYNCEQSWKHHFEEQIRIVSASSPVPVSVWRASRKGAEGRQWWEVNGPLMLRRYLDARPAEPTMDIPVVGAGGIESVGGIEADLTVHVPTPYGPLPFNGKLDRVTAGHVPGHPERGALIIRDYKTSYERPTDTTQLGDYAHVLRATLAAAGGPIADVPIYGTYFDARRGTWTEPVDLLAAHPFEAFQYRVTTAYAQRRALTTGPTPARPSSFCGGCSVRYACPIMASKS